MLFTSRNDHDKNMTKMYGIGLIFGVGMDFQAKEWSFLFKVLWL
jgi:hypothetical protein